MPRSLTPKQEKFCFAYLETGNASEAYRQSYDCGRMKEASVNRKAVELLENVKITARLGELRAATIQRHEITVDKIIRELALIGFSNMLDYVTPQSDGTVYIDLSKLTREQAAAIGEVTVEEYTEGKGEDARPVKRVKFKLSDKRSALVDLGKHLGMFPTQVAGKIEHNHKHDHEHRAVSETARWVEGLLGAGSGRSPQKPLPN
jgi:phage terminase small subunit